MCSWQSYRSEPKTTIGAITAANIVGVMIMIREHWASVANYVEGILKRDLEAVEQVCVGGDEKGI